MGFVDSSNRSRFLKRAAVISLIGVVGAGCSSDFTRFDPDLYTASIETNQPAANQSGTQNSNPYPDEVDPVSTGSIQPSSRSLISRPPAPAADVNTTLTYPQGNQTSATNKSSNTHNTYNTYQNTGTPAPLGIANGQQGVKVDAVTTASIDPVRQGATNKRIATTRNSSDTSNSSNSTGPYGWTGIGGTVITMQDGETLYNISKRYGVPVKELLKVNKINNADRVFAGQRITIPTYIYSERAPVSAPDNNPRTRAARSDKGMIGEENVSNLTSAKLKQSKKLTSAGSKAVHLVAAGDTLGAIAGKYDTRVSDIMLANGLDNSRINVGQKLIIPGKSAFLTVKKQTGTKNEDARRLARIKELDAKKTVANTSPKPYSKPRRTSSDEIITGAIEEKAPPRTGIDTFRWPATGRVLSKFGERRRGAVNEGIDISVPEGTSVKAAENGVVIYSDNELPEYGNMLLVRHDGGWVSAYAHNKILKVDVGENVRRGQIIAKSGRTGDAERPMIHFELRRDSNPVNPQKYLR